jgi:cholesterol transport system auxiliary component
MLSVLAMLACVGCAGSLLESRNEAPEVYRLNGPALTDRGEPLDRVIAIGRPRAPTSLDTDRIAVLRPGSRFDYYSGIRWAESAPEMIQQLLVRGVAADGRFETVVAAPSRVPPDLLLDTELRRFEAQYPVGGDVPRVFVELQASVVDARAARRIASFTIAADAAATDNRRGAVLEAFERAAADAVESAVSRLRESVSVEAH